MVYLILMNLKTTQSHIRLNMVSCLAAGQLVFIIGISATRHKVLCTAVALTINYFYLVAFGWMVAEGVMLYLKVVKVFNVMTTTKYFYGFAWGFPTILVVSAVVTNVLIKGSMDSSMRDDVCWFSFSSGFVWVFIGPVLMACLVNLVILLRIVVEMMRLTDMSGISETNSTRQSLKACAVLSPLLGFTWMFGVLTVTDTTGLVFQYFFTILNSLQGFFIFIFHVIRSKEIKAALEIRRQRWETTRSISVATEKSTIGRGRVSTAREKGNSLRGIDMNKISPDETSNINRDMPTVM
ncbi:adhesion G-protein coupled receptor D1-like [Porites lutea]|uniref:adhesion G-protein coupled receptor D1-like n=1 Tax=Porites lutea TaxID=51062 RepID=UPI003CC5B32A